MQDLRPRFLAHRRVTTALWLLSALGCAALAWGGCAAGGSSQGQTSTGSGGAGGGTASDTATASGNSSSTGDIGGFGPTGTGTASSGTGGGGVSAAYAHTNTELFKFDPSSANLTMTSVGMFDCIGGQGQDSSMTDIAVNDQGDLWAISTKNVYQLALQGGAVHCAKIIPLNNAKQVKFYGLSFAPAGALGPNEVLVAGNTDGELWSIDQNGALTLLGNLGKVPANDGQGHTYPQTTQTMAWELSGDIVFLSNNNMPVGFATVRDCPSPPSPNGCNKTDTLLEIDVSKLGKNPQASVALGVRGQVVKRAGCNDASGVPYGSMYGIAAWDSKVFGFAHGGAIVDIDNVTGGACLVSAGTNLWDGAGVTTVAPVIVPPPPK
jgi:hypothetical protein